MDGQQLVQVLLLTFIISTVIHKRCEAMSPTEKKAMREKVLEMFNHAYRSYMDNAYPLDELMPLSCKGRGRGTEPSRGDVDDCLGNFSLTLVDTLDTLVVLGQIEEFENAVSLVISEVNFDRNIVVSVFETNIRILGGLLGGHTMAVYLKQRRKGMDWYNNELLDMAQDLGYRLLPAFNTSTGIPYPRVNLRYGVKHPQSRTGSEKDTCTSCAGTMILEFSALSRMTGIPVFEEAAEKAMDQLWSARNRGSDLVGTVINIHNGDWVRRDSGVGAGIDSYYEYLLKAYILLGDESYLDRFNKHYRAVMKYISQGPMMVDVHMHRPLSNSKNFMDSLLAFWPGLQVLKGDIKPAIETHEMLYQIIQRHNFLPEAFTTDFRVHWAQHPLRPEFIESTYFIYKATGDPHYLEVGQSVIENLEKHARVPCGFAALKDVTTGVHEDQMDSFVLAETFKYLYLLFSDKEDLVLDVDSFVFTTEAHLLPLSLSMNDSKLNVSKDSGYFVFREYEDDDYDRSCPNTNHMFKGNLNFAQNLRHPMKNYVEKVCPKPLSGSRQPRLRAGDFMAGNKDQLTRLSRMGIRIVTMQDGRVQLLHTASEASSTEEGEDGMLFMQEMIELSKSQAQEVQQEPRMVQLISPPHLGSMQLNAGPAQFGLDIKTVDGVYGQLALATPYRGCKQLVNHEDIRNKIVIMERGECMFIDKARSIQADGAIGGIVIDNAPGSSSKTMPLFAMSGDGKTDVTIPMLFLFHYEGSKLLEALKINPELWVRLGYQSKSPEEIYTVLRSLNIPLDLENMQTSSDSTQTTTTTTTPTQTETSTQNQEAKQTSFVDDIKETKDMLQDLVKKLSLKDVNVRLRSKVAGQGQTATGPDNVNIQQIHIPAQQLLNKDDAKANTAFRDMMSLLETQQSGPNLNNQQKNYLEKVKKMIHTTLQSGNGVFGSEVQQKLDELTQQLKPKSTQKSDLKEESEEEVGEGDEDRGPLEATLDNLSKQLDAALDSYINDQFDKVLEEAKRGLEDVYVPETPKVETPGGETVDTTDQAKVSTEEVPKTELSQEDHQSYATQKELEATSGDKPKRYRPPNVQKAPEWMALEEGQIFIDQEGNIFVKDGPDDIEGHLDLEREAEEYGEQTDSPVEHSKLDYDKLRNNLFAQQDSLAGQEESSAGSEEDAQAKNFDLPKIKLDIKSLTPSDDTSEGEASDSLPLSDDTSEGEASDLQPSVDSSQEGSSDSSTSSSQDSLEGEPSADSSPTSQDSHSQHSEQTASEAQSEVTDFQDEL